VSLDATQLALRRTGVTATDVPAILGLSPWRSPLDVWLDKKGLAAPVEENEDMQRGNFLEDGARRWYAHRTGAKVALPGTVVSSRDALLIATPDGVALHQGGDVRGLEIKMPSSAHGWGEPGTDAVPDYYVPQVAWQLAAMAEWTETVDVFAVLEGKPRLYHVRRDEELEGLLVEDMKRWWRDYVVADKPPPATHADLPNVSRAFRRSDGDALEFGALTPRTQVVVEEYLRAYQEEAAATERRSLWETRAKLALGSAPCIRGLPEALGFHRLDWREQKGRTEWKAVALELARRSDLTQAQLEALASEHVGQGSRPFVPRPITKKRET
jgi:putative phage-type endonuclease